MPIKFIPDDEKSPAALVFSMVEDNQFFINKDEFLCQKAGDFIAHQITDQFGFPNAKCRNYDAHELIKKILPRITKIEF